MSLVFLPWRRIAPTRLSVCLMAVILGLVASPLFAQSGTGTFEGVITDTSGAALPGVTVTATSPALQVPSVSAVSGGDGTYTLRTLPVGIYQLRFELEGFSPIVQQNVRVSGGFTATINVEMRVGAMAETLTVVGEAPVVDIRSTTSQTTLTQALLDAAPVTRTFWQALGMAPGVKLANYDVGGSRTGSQTNYKTYGVGGQGSVLLDGFDTSHDGAGSSMFYIDYGSLEEVQVSALGNGADVQNPGVVLQGVVKSGGNDFHGRYVFSGQNESMTSDNVDDAMRAAGIANGDKLKNYYDFSADLGGRIVRDKLWFFGSYSRQAIEKKMLGYKQSPGPDGRFGTADDVEGFPPVSNSNTTMKFSYQASTKTKLVALTSYQNKFDKEESAATFTPFESTHNYHFPSLMWKGELQRTFSNTVLLNIYGASVDYDGWRQMQEGVDRKGNPSRYDITTTWFTGPAPAPYRDQKDNYESTGTLSFFGVHGHDLKVGYMVDTSARGRTQYNKASGNYQLQFDNGNPFQIVTYNFPIFDPEEPGLWPTTSNKGRGGARMSSQSVFVQDSWRPVSRLTLNLGVRTERFHNFTIAAEKAQGQFGTTGTFPEVDIITWVGAVPRLGAAYDLMGNGKTVLKGTYSVFNWNPQVGFSANWNKNTQQSTTYRWRDLNGNGDYDAGEVNLDLNGADFVSTTGAANILLNPDLDQPKRHEASVVLEHEVAANFSMRGAYVYKTNVADALRVNVARPYSAYDVPLNYRDPGPDGVVGNSDDGGNIVLYDYNNAYRGAAFVQDQFVNRVDDRKSDSWQSYEITANKRQTAGLPIDLVASYLATKAHRWIVGYAQSPNDNNFPLDETWEWYAKLTVNYVAPYDIRLSAFHEVASGAKGQRTNVFRNLPNLRTLTVPLEEFGAQSLPNTNITYMRIAKRFSTQKYKLELQFDMHNVFNLNTPINMSFASGPTFGQLNASQQHSGGSAITLPRTMKVGATFSF